MSSLIHQVFCMYVEKYFIDIAKIILLKVLESTHAKEEGKRFDICPESGNAQVSCLGAELLSMTRFVRLYEIRGIIEINQKLFKIS